ncbi:DUF6243 family protein [Streptomyces sp. NPDC048659]|uniref:DUF6243 family protein n=1 Tax=Streptomyces sp. NPDC048659 TaxID=3155489 RepID=UPI0034285CF9
MPDSKNINNPIGQGGGQRKRQSRAERDANGPHRNFDRRTAAEKKAELVRKMREKTGGGKGAEGSTGAADAAGAANGGDGGDAGDSAQG